MSTTLRCCHLPAAFNLLLSLACLENKFSKLNINSTTLSGGEMKTYKLNHTFSHVPRHEHVNMICDPYFSPQCCSVLSIETSMLLKVINFLLSVIFFFLITLCISGWAVSTTLGGCAGVTVVSGDETVYREYMMWFEVYWSLFSTLECAHGICLDYISRSTYLTGHDGIRPA